MESRNVGNKPKLVQKLDKIVDKKPEKHFFFQPPLLPLVSEQSEDDIAIPIIESNIATASIIETPPYENVTPCPDMLVKTVRNTPDAFDCISNEPSNAKSTDCSSSEYFHSDAHSLPPIKSPRNLPALEDQKNCNSRLKGIFSNRIGTQLQLIKPVCSCCQGLEIMGDFCLNYVNTLLKKCPHKTPECCCKNTAEPLLTKHANHPKEELKERMSESPFAYQFDVVNNEVRIYCTVCMKYSGTKAGRKRKNDFSWNTGIIFPSAAQEKRDKTRHIASTTHLAAVEHVKNEDDEQSRRGYPTSSEQAQCTDNALTAAMFIVNHILSHCIYPHLCTLLSLITPKDTVHPLGNRHQSHTSIKKMLDANFYYVKSALIAEYSNESLAKKNITQVTLSVDKGTAPKDVTRQVVVATAIGCDGLPHEKLLVAPPILKGDAESTTENVITTVKRFINLKQISFVATDSASYYIGKHSGMIERMKKEEECGKITSLPDFCHKVERLMHHTMPKWVDDVLDSCRSIAYFINEHHTVKNHLHEFINVAFGYEYTVVPTMCETRFAQYLSFHLKVILKNIKLLIAALPSLQLNPLLSDKVTYVPKHITSEVFISKLLIICETYKKISVLDKEAQSEVFGPFQYLSLIDRFKEILSVDSLPSSVEKCLDSGVLQIGITDTCEEPDFKDVVETLKRMRKDGKIISEGDIYHSMKTCYTNIRDKLEESGRLFNCSRCYVFVALSIPFNP